MARKDIERTNNIPWSRGELRELETLEKRKITPYQLWLELRKAGWFRSYNATEHKIRELKQSGKLRPKDTRDNWKIAYLDIETTELYDASFGDMLCWVLVDRDTGKVSSSLITPEELRSETTDRRVCRELAGALAKYDAVVTYNGWWFDVPFTRTRSLVHGLWFPGSGDLRHIDLYQSVKRLLRLRSYRLKYVLKALGLPGKHDVDAKLWKMASRGHVKALKEVLKHCVVDVRRTEKLHKLIEPFTKGVLRSI